VSTRVTYEPWLLSPAPGGLCAGPDADSDGVTNASDNCPFVANADQTDTDGDGLGNACDADDDNDGVLDTGDNCPLVANSGQADNDHDGIGDACDSDDDNDGIADTSDNCPFTANPRQADNDHDGIGDACTAFQFPAGGLFVVGNLANLTGGSTVTFWSSQWTQNNPLSGGAAPNAFKGFEDGNGTPSCGGTWTSKPGNSSSPPATVPTYMGVIVSSSITKNGSSISGNVKKIIVIKTNPGYGPAPGKIGTGTVVAIICQ
jgi:hypothetical protein